MTQLSVQTSALFAAIRRFCDVSNHSVPVKVVDDFHAPIVLGDIGGCFTKAGNPILYPNAYSKIGFSNMTYRCDTRLIYVGQRWIECWVVQSLKAVR